MWQIWLIAAGAFFLVEMLTVGFLVFWLGVGALITMLFSFWVDNIYLQAVIFVLSSTCLIFFTKPFVNKFIGKDKKVATNAYSIIGKRAIVTKNIEPDLGLGQIKVAGETWSAKSISEQVISEGQEVEIVSIEGVKAVVDLVSSNKNVEANTVSK